MTLIRNLGLRLEPVASEEVALLSPHTPQGRHLARQESAHSSFPLPADLPAPLQFIPFACRPPGPLPPLTPHPGLSALPGGSWSLETLDSILPVTILTGNESTHRGPP